MVEWRFVFDDSVNGWRYCPVCGKEILEVYTGDYHGMISCMGDHENEIVEFEIVKMENGKQEMKIEKGEFKNEQN